MNITVNLNNEKNGIELIFEAKPSADTLAAVKAQGFRWHNAKKFWYAKQTADRLTFARSLGDLAPAPVVAPAADCINMDGVGHKELICCGSDLAKVIREELKRRGVKGVTVRSGRSGYTTGITLTIKASSPDFVSIEEAKKRFNMSAFTLEVDRDAYIGDRWLYMSEWEHMTPEEQENAYNSYLMYNIKKLSSLNIAHNYKGRKYYWELTTAFYERVCKIFEIANQWNYNNSDIMTDYFDVGYYLDIELKKPADFEPREKMTETERTAYDAEIAEEIRQQEEALKAYREEQERARIESEKHEKWIRESEQLIYNDAIIEDLPELDRIYITSLVGGCGKECNMEELNESIKECPHYNDALITRAVRFTSPEAYERFTSMFLCDFEFLARQGGTASEDVRLEEIKELYQLNTEQRESVKFYCNKCVAIYLNDKLQLIIDPQGYDYARYVYILSDTSEILTASKELKAQAQESKTKEPFYFPAPLSEQIESIAIGDEVTIYQCDGWILNNIYGGSGVVIGIKPGTYAQYSGYYIELMNGRKCSTAFIRDSKECLIYQGVKPLLPESVTHALIDAPMSESYNYDVLFPNVLKYYKDQGENPIVDTYQR